MSLELRCETSSSGLSFAFAHGFWAMVGRTGRWDLGARRVLLHHRLRVACAWGAAVLLGELRVLLR